MLPEVEPVEPVLPEVEPVEPVLPEVEPVEPVLPEVEPVLPEVEPVEPVVEPAVGTKASPFWIFTLDTYTRSPHALAAVLIEMVLDSAVAVAEPTFTPA